MGVVYRARHMASERAVALKTVSFSAPRWLDNIRREIGALTRIRHPGVVRIIDHGVHQGIPWYAMDLLEGESLRHYGQRIWSRFRVPPAHPVASTQQLNETTASLPVPATGTPQRYARTKDSSPTSGAVPAAAGELREVLRIVRRVCATLAFLHGEGFVTCDLKPENIFLVNANPILIDFGLMAHHAGGSGREALDVLPAMAGTLPYMSPEQIRGELVDARSDLYSLGCLLYELVAGRPPFSGVPKAVLHSHLVDVPLPPSNVVADIPEPLQRLILKLLEKQLDRRFGYADEVATLLAEIGDDPQRLADFPPPRSYLYRPRFVGRNEIVQDLVSLRDKAIDGAGRLVLLGGQSGAGKTRVAMELARTTSQTVVRVVTSEASPLSSERQGTTAATPLHALRPLLRAVADHCQQGGPDTTERLVGESRAVLALYEPLLAQVPALTDTSPPIPQSVEASRKRLFSCLADVLRAFAREQPLLWVIDDLGWADELSLSFLQSLTREYLESAPVLLVCAYRTEETTDAVNAIAKLSHVEHLTLPRLARDAIASIISDTLAMNESETDFVEFITTQAEGNPFFVGEYLRTAVAERTLYRDEQHAWRLVRESPGLKAQYHSLPLPSSLRDLIEQRLRSISIAGQHLALTAAVLGREAETDVVREVSALSEDAVLTAIDELLRRQVLEQAGKGHLRFAHDKLREVLYERATSERLSPLHSSAADVLERRMNDGVDSRQHWASLGHHFAAAGRFEPASRYLKLAADHARAAYANHEALWLCREAIKQVNHMLSSPLADVERCKTTLVELHEAMADLHALAGDRQSARAAYESATMNVRADHRSSRARLSRKMGKTWDAQHEPTEALRSYANALSILEEMSASSPSYVDARETMCEWIQVHIDRLWVYYYTGHVPGMHATIATVAPVIDEHGTPAQRALFFRNRTLLNFRRHVYVITEETVRFAKAALEACLQDPTSPDLPLTKFVYGFTLVFRHSLEEGEQELAGALTLAKRAGDGPVQARCLTYLTLVARMRGNVGETCALAEQCAQIAGDARAEEYVAAAAAHKAWVHLKRREIAGAEACGYDALRRWRSMSALFPFHWMALIPLIEVALLREDLARAGELASGLMAPGQQYLPGSAADGFARATDRWHAADLDGTRDAVARALRHLDGTGYR
jgi:serine/threonine protein kinase